VSASLLAAIALTSTSCPWLTLLAAYCRRPAADYAAAYTIDRRWMGRKRLQTYGFLMMFILFLMCGIFYNDMLDHAIQVFQTLYFLSSFFNQCGE
jgi:hypothetical protein